MDTSVLHHDAVRLQIDTKVSNFDQGRIRGLQGRHSPQRCLFRLPSSPSFYFLGHNMDIHGGRVTEELVNGREVEIFPPSGLS